MKIDKQDEVIDRLYQQRKSSIIAPNVVLTAPEAFKHNQSKRFSFAKFLLVLLGGGLASFSILAVISHLAKAPSIKPAVKTALVQNNVIEYEQDDLSELTAQAIETEITKIKQTLPELSETVIREPVIINAQTVDDSSIEYTIENTPFALMIKQPALAIELTHKVLPKYPKEALINQILGSVTLSYQVLNSGRVDHIKIVKSSDYRLFDKSAIDALSQWRYLSNEKKNKVYLITFEFTKP